MDTVPLTTLLSWTWIALVIEADNAFEAASSDRVRQAFRISFAMWANGLRCIDESGVTVGELLAASRAVCNLGGLERWGWIAVADKSGAWSQASGHRRAGYGSHRGITDSTMLRPTRAGSLARRAWPKILERVDEAWEERFGDGDVGALQEALSGLGGGMPWAVPEVHHGDGFWTRVHGVDGSASGTLDDTRLPLAALLGQALTRLTLDHESESQVSLPLAANGLRLLGDGPVRIRDLPARSGISKEAVAMLTGYLARNGLAELAPGRTISLRSSGTDALENYRRGAAERRDASLAQALQELLARSDALSAGLVPPAGAWRGEARYSMQTARLLADPTGALPWQPMVLHRGGWPDGS